MTLSYNVYLYSGLLGDKWRTDHINKCGILKLSMTSLKIYQYLKDELGDPLQIKSNILLVSLPAMGAGHLVKKYIEENPQIKYVNGPGQELGDKLTIIYIAYDIDNQAFKWVDSYVRASGSGQNFILVLNSPGLMTTEKYLQTYLSGHVYKTIFLKCAEIEDVQILAKDFDNNLSEDEIGVIYQLSGGLPQLVKFLAINKSLLTKKNEEIITDENLQKIIEPLAKSVLDCTNEVLEKMGILDKGIYKSELLKTYVDKKGGKKAKIDIVINFDLSIEENGEKTGREISLKDKQILEELIAGDGDISKEKISDIKWGEGKYDEYSDQAINKTIRRLSAKLKEYKIETIPKVGYRIVKK